MIVGSMFSVLLKLLCDESFEAFVILLAALLPIKSPVASPVFLIVFFEVVLSTSAVDFLTLSRRFWLYLPLTFLPIFSSKDKTPRPFTYA